MVVLRITAPPINLRFSGAVSSPLGRADAGGRSLGMSKVQVFMNYSASGIAIALPGWSNEYPILLTDSSVTYA